MFRRQVLTALGAAGCLLSLSAGANAAQITGDQVYGFRMEDFSPEIGGICITDLDDAGTYRLGDRVLRPGDVLTRQQLSQMTFVPAQTQQDRQASLEYLPIGGSLGEPAVMTIGIRGREDQPPVAEDAALETYKNLPLTGRLPVQEPESQTMEFQLVRQPRRGTVELHPDGTFTYSPKKNKVGVDSFTFTAADPAGNQSREATVTVQILKPTDRDQYTDTLGRPCRFAAEWMRHTGIFAGEQVGQAPCFSPDRLVTRGEFVAMTVKALDIPVDPELVYTGYTDEIPTWLQPYLAAAVRAGLTAGLAGDTFQPQAEITQQEAAAMLQTALDLTAPALAEEPAADGDILAANGIFLEEGQLLTREAAALALYQASRLMK